MAKKTAADDVPAVLAVQDAGEVEEAANWLHDVALMLKDERVRAALEDEFAVRGQKIAVQRAAGYADNKGRDAAKRRAQARVEAGEEPPAEAVEFLKLVRSWWLESEERKRRRAER